MFVFKVRHTQKILRYHNVRNFFSELTPTQIRAQQPAIQCRNRKHLAGSHSESLPEYLPIYVNKYFKGIQIDDSSEEKLKSDGIRVRKLLDGFMNQNYSAVLIKNLPITEASHFRDFVDGLGYTDMSYASGTAIRERVNDLVYTASDEPPSFCVEPHNEMSYLSVYPTKVFIFYYFFKKSLSFCVEPSRSLNVIFFRFFRS